MCRTAQYACAAHGIGIKKKGKGTLVLAINNDPTDSDKLHHAAMAFIQQIYMYMYISLTRTVVFAIQSDHNMYKKNFRRA